MASLIGVVAMVAVGGTTRLTGSGLSIVEWRPVTGAIPPLDETEWNAEFAKYRATPQFRFVNARMTIEGFKRIYFWEYLHRLLGRAVGLVFALPLLYWMARGRLDSRRIRRFAPVLVLGAAQGAIGWLMVKSGLVQLPHVSHYRLALHLLTALALFSWLLWLWLDERDAPRSVGALPRGIWRHAPWALLALITLQITAGALTAGLRAGFSYNTYPKMMGSWMPAEPLGLTPVWRNFVDSGPWVQWLHRWLGALFLLLAGASIVRLRRVPLSTEQRSSLLGLGMVACAQFALGVLTLVLAVPIQLGVLHQLGACAVLACSIGFLHASRRAER